MAILVNYLLKRDYERPDQKFMNYLIKKILPGMVNHLIKGMVNLANEAMTRARLMMTGTGAR